MGTYLEMVAACQISSINEVIVDSGLFRMLITIFLFKILSYKLWGYLYMQLIHSIQIKSPNFQIFFQVNQILV